MKKLILVLFGLIGCSSNTLDIYKEAREFESIPFEVNKGEQTLVISANKPIRCSIYAHDGSLVITQESRDNDNLCQLNFNAKHSEEMKLFLIYKVEKSSFNFHAVQL